MLIPRVKSRVKAVEVCFTTFSSRGKTKFICILHMKSLLANSRPGGRTLGRYHKLRGGGTSSNVKFFEGELFASIAAKILGDGRFTPGLNPLTNPRPPYLPLGPRSDGPWRLDGSWHHHHFSCCHHPYIQTSKMYKNMEFLVLILFSNMFKNLKS